MTRWYDDRDDTGRLAHKVRVTNRGYAVMAWASVIVLVILMALAGGLEF